MMREVLAWLSSCGAGLVALAAALLPSRYWNTFEHLPLGPAALPSAILTALAGAAFGARAFVTYVSRAAAAASDATLEIAARQLRGEWPGAPPVTTLAPQAVSAVSIVAFLFFTPAGWLAVYLVASGLVRAASAFVEEPLGDPALTLADALAVSLGHRVLAASDRRVRESQEGPEVPDRLFTGEWAGLPDVDLVVVASRRKPGWTRGTFVVTSDARYTLGEPFEMRLPGGLRTVYPLVRQQVHEVMRRGVAYELPPLEGTRRAPRREPLD